MPVPKHVLNQRRRTQASPRPAFTLIELLVVIGVIALLMAIVTVVGGRVILGGKRTLTQDTMRTLDVIYDAYMADKDVRPDAGVRDPRTSNPNVILPVADARNMTGQANTIINSVGLFIYQMELEGQPVQQTIAALNSRLVTLYSPDANAQPVPVSPAANSAATLENQALPLLRTVMDPWGRPLRYVHPAYSGGLYDAARQTDGTVTYGNPPNPYAPFDVRIPLSSVDASDLPIKRIRRNAGEAASTEPTIPGPDSDGGIGPNFGGRAYFYSAGPDGDPSTIDDNVYIETSRPTFPK